MKAMYKLFEQMPSMSALMGGASSAKSGSMSKAGATTTKPSTNPTTIKPARM